mmetsp:Transcript_22554/g.64983  ORF Transcript_22554/g.64983 Transcript_22554/m.64983 type:complete len:901 (+) Transcript_22554:78-2780(+)
MWAVENTKWKNIPDIDDEEVTGVQGYGGPDEAEMMLQAAYASEVAQEQQVDRLKELKIKMAVDAYEKRRPADKIMHHYLIKDAGDAEAIGEYLPTGDTRGEVPVYKNANGLVLSRERQPLGPDTDQETWGWVIGNMQERRPLYGVISDDLSVPTLGWAAFTAPEPLPVLRYFTEISAARLYRERGNAAFQKRDWAGAEEQYGKGIGCNMDPAEYGEIYGMLHSNRAEVRIRQGNFGGAAEDAETAMKFLRSVTSDGDATNMLRQKTYVRHAKALQAMKRLPDALKTLSEARQRFSGHQEIERLLEETQMALQADSRSRDSKVGKGAATPEMLSFVGKTTEELQAEIAAAGTAISDFAFPEGLNMAVKKLEYTLGKAKQVQGACLADLQVLLRTNGGLRSLLQLVGAQWKSNVDGKAVDAYKLHSLASAATAVALACEGSPESLKLAASEASCLFAVLGGCNRKVDAATCEHMASLAAGLWEHCRARTLDEVQVHSIVVERAAAYLSKAVLAEVDDDVGGPDSPVLPAAARRQAAGLLVDLLAAGGRVEKRALRGMAPQLAGPEGEGYFTAEADYARSLGEIVASKALQEPQLLSAREVKNLLLAVQLLVISGPCADASDEHMALLSFDEFAGDGATMRYVDLIGWDETEDGKHAATMLKVVSKALEFRLLKKDRELERDNFEDAFHAGNGYFVVIPLIQAPPAFAEHALLILAVMAQMSSENVNHIVGLSAIHALVGMPSPEGKPMPTCVDQTLKTSCGARKHAAKLLSRTVETQVTLELLKNAGEKCIKELVKLATQVREDGKGNLESFHDMLHVFFQISQLRPGPLCRYIPVDMMHLFVELSQDPAQDMAREIVAMLKRDPVCNKALAPIVERAEAGRGMDAEDELEMQATRVPRGIN